MTRMNSTKAIRPTPPASSADTQTSSESRLARQFVRRASAVERGHQTPWTYRQNSHRYRAVGGTAHGTAGQYLAFADTRTAHGIVPAAPKRLPAITARTTTGSRLQNDRIIG